MSHQGPHAMHGLFRVQTGTLGAIAGVETLTFAQRLAAGGLTLAALQPLVVAACSAVCAYATWRKLRDDNRRAAEVHTLTVARLKVGLPCVPGVEQFDPRRN